MRKFTTGATRDSDETKYDFEGFLSPAVLRWFAKYMHTHRVQADGSLRDSDNWQKGIPKDAYMKSMTRHFMDVWSLHRGETADETMEEALPALLFNIMGYMFETLKAEQQLFNTIRDLEDLSAKLEKLPVEFSDGHGEYPDSYKVTLSNGDAITATVSGDNVTTNYEKANFHGVDFEPEMELAERIMDEDRDILSRLEDNLSPRAMQNAWDNRNSPVKLEPDYPRDPRVVEAMREAMSPTKKPGSVLKPFQPDENGSLILPDGEYQIIEGQFYPYVGLSGSGWKLIVPGEDNKLGLTDGVYKLQLGKVYRADDVCIPGGKVEEGYQRDIYGRITKLEEEPRYPNPLPEQGYGQGLYAPYDAALYGLSRLDGSEVLGLPSEWTPGKVQSVAAEVSSLSNGKTPVQGTK